jgi:adenosylcobinamide-GDP ribazoletransferase
MIRPFLIALRFLTRLPVPLGDKPSEKDIGRSLLYYPLVGLLIGLLLAATAWALANAPALLRAALVLAAWVLLTGALHLDGLADSADAWVGGHGDRAKTLRIMKDPACGPMGVVVLVLVLLVKFAALHALTAAGDWTALVLAPLLARTALPLLFLTTPYVRPGGLGAALAAHLPRRTAMAVVTLIAVAVPLTTGGRGLWLLATTAAVFLLLRALMRRRLHGTTGDTAGAMVELIEATVLVAMAMMWSA